MPTKRRQERASRLLDFERATLTEEKGARGIRREFVQSRRRLLQSSTTDHNGNLAQL